MFLVFIICVLDFMVLFLLVDLLEQVCGDVAYKFLKNLIKVIGDSTHDFQSQQSTPVKEYQIQKGHAV